MTGLPGRLARAAGLFLIVVPFLPLRRLFGGLEGASILVPPAEWMLGISICGALAWLVALLLEELLDRGVRLRWPLPAAPSRPAIVCGLLLAVLVSLLTVSRLVFRGRPHLVDSIAQLFQARIFASGLLAAPPPALPEFFATQQMLIDGSGWYAQYPPGHAALLAIGYLLGAAWLVPVVLSVGTAGLIYLFTARVYGRRTSLVALGLTLICPFFLFMGASFMNHVSTLFFVTLFLYLYACWDSGGSPLIAALAGAALGVAFLSRPLTAAAIGLVFAVAALRSGGRDAWRSYATAAIAGVTVASVYFVYNAATTGDPLLPGYVKLWGGDHGLGFHATPWGQLHTPVAGLRNELLDISLLNLALFEWPLPALLPIGLGFALGWLSMAWDRRLLAAFLAIPAAYFFYWHRDAFLGPRFLYSGLALVLPLTAHALVEGARRLGGRRIRLGSLFHPVRTTTLVGAVLALCVAYSLVYAIPQRARVYATGLRSMKIDILADARAAGIERGLIFVHVSWGNRLIARLHGLGVSASLAEVAYRSVDHCQLQELIDRSTAGGDDARTVSEALLALVSRNEAVRPSTLNGDPTLRLLPGASLSEACRRQLSRDSLGYSVYAPHLPLNSPRLDGPFVVARDLGKRNSALTVRYPDHPAYLYRNGVLTRLP
jgi:hypothetical protein